MFYQEAAPTKPDKITQPSIPKVSLAGMRPFVNQHFHLALNQLARKHGDIFQMKVGARNFVVLNEYSLIKEALVKQQDIFNNREDFDVFKQPPQSEFLELKSGEAWKKHRDILMQVMHTFLAGKTDIHEGWIDEEAELLVNRFLKTNGQSFNPESYIPLASMNFMQRLVFSKISTAEDKEFVKTAHSIRRLPHGLLTGVIMSVIPKLWLPMFALLNLKTIRAFLKGLGAVEQYIESNIEQHRKSFDSENLRDITDGLLKASDELTESEKKRLNISEKDIVKGSLIQFVAAGTQVPNFILRWGLLYMIAYPEIQTKVQQELDEVIGDRQISFKDRSKLPFTEACINEILRHSSTTTVPAVNYATTSDTILGDYFIPQNTPLVINYYSLTRDERCWENPEEFNPYRFLDKNGKLRKDLLDKFYPFGIGPRRCLGEYLGRFQIFTFLVNLLRKCRFERVPGEELSFEAEFPGPFVFPKEYQLTVKPRF